MDEVQVEKTDYQMPPVEGFTIAHFLTVADLERSMNFYATVFGGDIVSRGDGNVPPGKTLESPRSGSSSTSGLTNAGQTDRHALKRPIPI